MGSLPKKKRTKENPLLSDLSNFQIDTMHGGGYYVLRDIQMGPGSNQFCDIFILLGSIEDAELQFKFNAVNEANQTSPD